LNTQSTDLTQNISDEERFLIVNGLEKFTATIERMYKARLMRNVKNGAKIYTVPATNLKPNIVLKINSEVTCN
jgi:hypothetical protein